MKFGITSLSLIVALSPAVNAWSLYADGETIGADQNVDVSCDSLSLSKGDKISFYEGVWENCVMQLFADSSCSDWVGTTEDDWKDHKLGTSVGSYSVECSI